MAKAKLVHYWQSFSLQKLVRENMDHVDAIVIGAGVVGLAIAAELSKQYPNTLIIDQHPNVGQETSSRNSEVIHAGIYYPTGSLKAQLCIEGKHQLYEHCQKYRVPHSVIGKLIIAVDDAEITSLHKLHAQAQSCGVLDLQPLNQQGVSKLEPEVTAVQGLLSPSTGIIDSHAFMQSLLWQLEERGGFFVGNSRFIHAQTSSSGYRVLIENQDGGETILDTQVLVNASGLYASQTAKSIEPLKQKFIPITHYARGHYFTYSGKHPFQHLIYPMPESNTKGLGVHGTLDMGGQLRFGPDVQYLNDIEYTIPEDRKPHFVKAIQRYWPNLNPNALHPGYSGIRPKLQGPNDPFMDFQVQGPADHRCSGLVNLYGIESPGLTSSLAIASYVKKLLE